MDSRALKDGGASWDFSTNVALMDFIRKRWSLIFSLMISLCGKSTVRYARLFWFTSMGAALCVCMCVWGRGAFALCIFVSVCVHVYVDVRKCVFVDVCKCVCVCVCPLSVQVCA